MEIWQKLNIKAVIWGAVADLVGSALVSFLLGMIWGFMYAASKGLTRPPSPEKMEAMLKGSVLFLGTGLFMGLCCTVMGGFIAGHVAKQDEVPNALAVGAIMMVFGMVAALTELGQAPLWYHAIGFLLTLPAAALGGYLRQSTRS